MNKKTVHVTCPLCGKESVMIIDVNVTHSLEGTTKVKGIATTKTSCCCEELKKAMDEAYRNAEV